MAQSTLVNAGIDDGRRFVERFAADGNSVQGAVWARLADDGIWFLHIISDIIDQQGPAAAYRAVHKALSQLPNLSLTSSEIKVVGSADVRARQLRDLIAHLPQQLGLRLDAVHVGGVEIDEYFIYPPNVYNLAKGQLMTSDELGREIMRLLNRGPGIWQPSRVDLKDGTSFSGVPFAVEVGAQQSTEVRFVEDGKASPRVVRLDEIASIS